MEAKKIKAAIILFLKEDLSVKKQEQYFADNRFSAKERLIVAFLINSLFCGDFDDENIKATDVEKKAIKELYFKIKSMNLI